MLNIAYASNASQWAPLLSLHVKLGLVSNFYEGFDQKQSGIN